MVRKKNAKIGMVGAIFGVLLAILGILAPISGVLTETAYAEPETTVTEDDNLEEPTEGTEETTEETETNEGAASESTKVSGDDCLNALGSIGWIVCPGTGTIAEATDWLYDRIESILIVDPIEAKDGSPIYEIWKYCRGVTNVVFIIFLLIVIYSQITGLGISNYGIKKALPKLIVVAVLVNLSFLLCSLAVDVSNVVGNSLRGVFTSVQETALAGMMENGVAMTAEESTMTMTELYSAIAGGTALAIGGAVIAFETGAIWMLIPVLLGAIVAVATGLITIAMRQAVVALLIMISPLAIVAYMLPNTEGWFKKWRDLLMRMLVFYPMFSVLFGASQLAGFAIIASAHDGFGVLLGVAVQIFPLFFSWKMMKMSGTFLGTINQGMNKLMAAPLATNRAWASSHRQLTRNNNMLSQRTTTPSLRLMKWLDARKVAREAEIAETGEVIKNQGMSYRATTYRYKKNGLPNRNAERAYRHQAMSMEYQRAIERDKNNLNKGLGDLTAVKEGATRAQKLRLGALDARVIDASDFLKVEQARAQQIEYDNAKGLYERLDKAINAHNDSEQGYSKRGDEYIKDENGNLIRNPKYKLHAEYGTKDFDVAMQRYEGMLDIMEGNSVHTLFAASQAATAYDTQKKILENSYQKFFELTPPTKDVEYRLGEITGRKDAAEYIDAIIPGLRILNQRGDTDLVRIQLDNVLTGGKNGKLLEDLRQKVNAVKANASLSAEEIEKQIEEIYKEAGLEANADLGDFAGVHLGTHASQALAGFLMFDVKDNDPFLRRFGKYINLETARAFNENDRQETSVTLEEYIKGYHEEPNGKRMYAKKSMTTLLEGTSFDGVERTAYDNMNDTLMEAYGFDKSNPDKEWDKKGYLEKIQETSKAIMPQFISANLKYLSGSEQISAAVKFLTGYKTVPIKDKDGNVIGSELSDEPIWDKYFGADADEARKVFQGLTRSYLEAQTPSQILGLRSDYRSALMRHLGSEFLEMSPDELSEDERALQREYATELADIQTRYGDLSASEAKERRKKDEDAFWKTKGDKLAGIEMRQLLDGKGKLHQIYRTRRSGAANNAKDWVRQWLELDNETLVNNKLEDRRAQEKKQLEEDKRATSGDDDGASDSGTVFTDVDRASFITELDDLWQDYRDESVEAFFEESVNLVRSKLGERSYIEWAYSKYREDEPAADNYMLREYLKELFSDPDNY